MARVPYDEFSMLHENAAEFSLPFETTPAVERVTHTLGDGRVLSGLRWGTTEPETVLLHGGAQNAHTWDTVCLAMGRSVLALDLPGHGHSDGGAGDPVSNAVDLVPAIAALAPNARTLVGMSLGGLTAMALAARERGRFARLALIDITPGVNQEKAGHITAFVNGPATFESFEDLLARTIEHNPTRSESSLRRGILHNAVQLDDGTWQWRYARHRNPMAPRPLEHGSRWDDLESLTIPVLLVRGMAKGSVVDDNDEARFLEVTTHGSVVRFENAGHSVQGDSPVELAALLTQFAES
jgi:pimeloyl-ACP methyl ester carboxylesterase